VVDAGIAHQDGVEVAVIEGDIAVIRLPLRRHLDRVRTPDQEAEEEEETGIEEREEDDPNRRLKLSHERIDEKIAADLAADPDHRHPRYRGGAEERRGHGIEAAIDRVHHLR